MAQYNFEGSFDNINDRQLEFINKVIQEQDLKVTKVFFSPVGQAGDNFVATVKRISIEGDNGTLKLILKVGSGVEFVRNMMNTDAMFNNEHTMYTEVLPKLVQLQKSAGVPEEQQLRYAKCYGSLNEAPNEVIILEDLCESDFTMLNKFVSLSDDCVKSILKNFAILHSLSFALKKKEPETYDYFKGKLIDQWLLMTTKPEIGLHLELLEKQIISILDDEDHKTIVKNKAVDIFRLATKFTNDDNRYSIIQQGDAWTNNVMFKFEGDKLVQSIMIDYQMSKSCSPAVDLLYMIFNCTDHDVRSKNYYNWLDYYHTELDNSLSNFGLKANFVYPRDQLDADLKRHGKILFGLCLLLSSVLMRDSKEAGEFMDNMKEGTDEALESMQIEGLQINTMLRLKNRIVGLIDSFTEFGLL